MFQSDQKLVQSVLQGQKQSFSLLVKRYEKSIRAVTMSIVKNHHAAQDATQEAFINAYEKLPALKKSSAFGPWLMQIARRKAIDMLRKRKNDQPLEDYHQAALSGNGKMDEDKQQLLSAVMKLPDSERLVVMLRYFDRHSVNEVAQIAGRSVGTVTKQLSRAYEHLRSILRES